MADLPLDAATQPSDSTESLGILPVTSVNMSETEAERVEGAGVAQTSRTATSVDAGDNSNASPTPTSKNAKKKAAKAERFAAIKLERRAREKEAKKDKKRKLAEKRAAGELDEADEEERKRRSKKPKVVFGGTVIVDLGFDEMMSDKEITSLSSQLAYTYSANRGASFPFSLVFTSLNGRTLQRLESLSDASYKRWSNAEWHSESYESLWKPRTSVIREPGPSNLDTGLGSSHVVPPGETPDTAATSAASEVSSHQEDTRAQYKKTSVVYLTADTEDELTELKPDETYIIGGICDHNRYKNLCLNKARESGIRTARLPIGRYLASLPTRKVLTVNQVFEILVKWVETKDWETALYSVIPKRKFQQGGKDDSTAEVVDAAAVEEGMGEDSS